jgi:hypothetical protein
MDGGHHRAGGDVDLTSGVDSHRFQTGGIFLCLFFALVTHASYQPILLAILISSGQPGLSVWFLW